MQQSKLTANKKNAVLSGINIQTYATIDEVILLKHKSEINAKMNNTYSPYRASGTKISKQSSAINALKAVRHSSCKIIKRLKIIKTSFDMTSASSLVPQIWLLVPTMCIV